MDGWVKIFRKMTEWEWYKDNRVKSVFIHLILNAEYDKENRGFCRLKYSEISEQTGLTIGEVRRSIGKLKMTGEIQTIRHKQETSFKIVNYEKFQATERPKKKRKAKKEVPKEEVDERIPESMRGRFKNYQEYANWKGSF